MEEANNVGFHDLVHFLHIRATFRQNGIGPHINSLVSIALGAFTLAPPAGAVAVVVVAGQRYFQPGTPVGRRAFE